MAILKDTSFNWAENGEITTLNETEQKTGFVPSTTLVKKKINADEVNFILNNLDKYQNEIIEVLNSIDMTSKIDLDGNNATMTALSNIAKENISKLFTPDYTAGVSISSGYTTTQRVWIYAYNNSTQYAAHLYINGIDVMFMSGGSITQDATSSYAIADIGDVITFTTNIVATIFPFK